MIESPLLANLGAYINGAWVAPKTERTIDVINPSNGDLLAKLPSLGVAETQAAIRAAEAALLKPPSPEVRAQWLEQISDRILANKTELGRIITLEHGKPHKEAIGEAEYAAGFFGFFAKQLAHTQAEELPASIRNCRWTIHHRPAGVVGLISPWNFPLAMIAKKLAPALGAGCACVIKPASQTPLSMIALMRIIHEVGLPAGQVNMVMGSAGPIGETLCSDPAVRIISFTGSTEVGRILMAQAAPHIKRLAMELGGNAPFIVFDDADIDSAVTGLIANKFRAGGQTCVCANRVYVHRAIADRFTRLAAERVSALRVGDGMDPQTEIGPLIDRAGFDKVAAHVRDAMARGAKRLAGTDPPRPTGDWGAFYPPTLLTDVTCEMLVCQEETFGPLVAVALFDREDDVVSAANSTTFGLAAYVYTKDAERAQRVIGRLKFGHVGLNTGTGPTPEAPFGGMKQSGFGREGGIEGLMEFCETQVVASA